MVFPEHLAELTIESTRRLNNGVEMPAFGLGVFRARAGRVAKNAVLHALGVGYRHIDTGKSYGNERSVGEAIRESGIPREEIFVTTKLPRSECGYDSAIRAFSQSLENLGLSYVDLYLIHWPVAGLRLDSWRAMEALLAEGKIRAIGVSNYMVRHLEELLEHSKVVPAVNQIELHPYNYLYRREIVELCLKNNIQLEAYAPLTRRHRLRDRKLRKLAAAYGKTAAQIL